MNRFLPALLLLTVFLSSACQPTLATRGNLVDPDDIALLSVGKSSKEDVRTIIGSPTSTAALDDNTWFYIGQNTEREGWRREEVTARRIVAVKFDEAGTLQSVEPLENSGRELDMVKRTTPTTGHNLTFAQQIFGNLGRFNDKSEKAPEVIPTGND